MPNCEQHSWATTRNCAGKWRRILTMAATLLASCALAVENGAQQVQTDWAISGPAPIAPLATPADLRQQMILDNIFFVHAPLLQKKVPPGVPQAKADPDAAWLRVAVRPDGVDGWRPADEHAQPLGNAPRPSLSQFFSLDPPSTPQARVGNDLATAPRRDEWKPPAAPVPPGESDDIEGHDAPSDDDESIGNAEPDIADENSDAEAAPDDASIAAENERQSQPLQVSPPPTTPLPPLTRQLMNLRGRVRGVLRGYYRKQLNSREHDPWEVMHGMLAYEVQSRIRQGGPRGDPITSVGWLCYNKPCKAQTLMHVTRDGKLRAKYGVGLQGHLGQLLAMLAQCNVSADYPIRVGKQQFTIQDLIEAEKETCYPNSELTFKLLAFQYYLDLNEKWRNDRGEEWDFPRLIREELAQPIRGAACGGTHRLSSLSLTVKARVRRGEPLDGEYARAAEFVDKYHQYAFQLQNRDGSLSTSWFRGRGDESDINRRIKTTGHILEWLCYSLSDEELRDQRTIRAVSYLANLMYSNYDNEWEVGPMCHATHALLLYDERVFEPYDRPGYAVSYRPRPTTAARQPRYSSRR